ncbi:MAG TPA: archaellin/type IV pilin N-terminal domain-containing protein [Thermoplasmata archaeon]|nr:archaellin/type IV pilin N-terminal domain-containing protein [Thermoplasmata archaeon]
MKTRTGNQRRWRKNSKRGVSPIIATILLVAITVVLAAVLYVLISGLTKGPGNTPLGSALATGNGGTGTCAAGNCTYTFVIQSASGGLTANGLKFQLLDSSGAIINSKVWSVTLVDVSACVVGVYIFGAQNAWSASGNTCTGGTPGLSSPIVSGDQLALKTTVAGGSISGLGDSLSIIGQGSFSGSVPASVP